MNRTKSHIIETKSKDLVRSKLHSNDYFEVIVREWNERDYGIDFLMELFEKGYPTGKIAFLQIKGKEKTIEKLKITEEVSCNGLSRSSIHYAKQKRIPYFLIFASLEDDEFYYIELQKKAQILFKDTQEEQKTATVRIPISNNSSENLNGLFMGINSYYE